LPAEVLAYYESVGKQIEVALGAVPNRNIVFTGAVRGEGNSTVISQFAEMLSRRGERVILVDGNPRHPSLHRHFAVPDSPGLADYVAGTASRDAIIHSTGFANLSLIPLGRCADRSQAERITENLGELVTALGQLVDYVLVDIDYIGSPFFSPSAVGAGDGTVLVIRAGKTNRQVAARACDTVRLIGGRILGVILNRREFPIPDFIYRRL
jgi:Mrp family chromosome partitioning ATPase